MGWRTARTAGPSPPPATIDGEGLGRRHRAGGPDAARYMPRVSSAWRTAPDGKTLASAGSDQAIRFWDADSGRQIRALRGHAERCERSVATRKPSPPRLRRHDPLRTPHTAVRRVPAGPGRISCVAYSPDGKTLASGHGDRTVRLWDTATGREVRVLRGEEGQVYGVAFSPDGKTSPASEPIRP